MAKSQLDFSGARGIIDPLDGLRASMQQASTNLGQMIIQDENRVRQARQDARQDKQDLLATPGTPEWLAAQKAQQEMKIIKIFTANCIQCSLKIHCFTFI